MFPPPPFQLARQIGNLFAALPNVEAIALSGSTAGEARFPDQESDIDLYVYSHGEIPLASRRRIVEESGGANRASLDLDYWGIGDEWSHAPTGIEVDIVYFDASWMENQISRVVEKHQASLGFTTCFWHTIQKSVVFFDPDRWFTNLQQRCQVAYPEGLRRNIIVKNHPVLRVIIPSYHSQIAKAVKRRDLVSINHRLAALFASYFDIIFALNRTTHPGEKRLIECALKTCAVLPSGMEADVTSVLICPDISQLPERVTRLLDHLDHTLEKEGFGRVL